MEKIWGLILAAPGSARALGKGMTSAGFGLILFGWQAHTILGRFARRAVRAGVESPQTLAEMFPTLPTWWIPETALGFGVCSVLMVAGLSLAHTAKIVSRY